MRRMRHAEDGEHLIQQAAGRIEDPDPQNEPSHRGHDGRQIIDRAIEMQPPHRRVQQHRQRQTAHNADGHADHHEAGVHKRLPEQRVVGHALARHRIVVKADQIRVIIEPDESGRRQHVVIAKADHDRKQNRTGAEDDESEQPRKGADVTVHPVLAPAAESPSLAFLIRSQHREQSHDTDRVDHHQRYPGHARPGRRIQMVVQRSLQPTLSVVQ